MSQAQLLPSLHALIPPSQHGLLLARLSTPAAHVELYDVLLSIYISTHAVTTPRSLHVKARRANAARPRSESSTQPALGKGVAELTPHSRADKPDWDMSLAYMSQPLMGQEYADVRVQATVPLDVVGLSTRGDVAAFVETLGFRHSHSFASIGHIFYLFLPTQHVLQLTVTRMTPVDGADSPMPQLTAPSSEPYVVRLEPARPVASVAARGELGLQDMITAMQDVAAGIDGIEWDTGR